MGGLCHGSFGIGNSPMPLAGFAQLGESVARVDILVVNDTRMKEAE
jgi:hypothetical protein